MKPHDDVPVVTLTNGLRVANFSSAHPFTFSDGTVLPACSKERAERLTLYFNEHEVANHASIDGLSRVPYMDLVLEWTMSPAVEAELQRMQLTKNIDIILVPLPVMTAMKEFDLVIGKCRVIRKVDRTSNQIHIDRFCR